VSYLWHQFGDLALVIAAVFWAWVIWRIIVWAKRSPRQFARTLCTELALLFGVLALLWAAHLSDKWL
jgi:cell division protein FtsW (lipid II flippase)